MSLPKPRSAIISPTESVQLLAKFKDQNGNPADLDSFPQITVTQPSGNVAIGPTSAGVFKLDTGVYGYVFSTAVGSSVGVYQDSWDGTLNGFSVTGNFNFVVYTTQMPVVNSDGYIALGDDVGFNYSQNALRNINKVIKVLRARLKSSGKARGFDSVGNAVFVDCDVYSVDQLATYAADALAMFNQVPFFTFFTWEDGAIIDNFLAVIAQGAALLALSSQALIERGREFTLNDNSIGFTPPSISELLNTQFGTELANYMEMVKMIKNSMRPSPLGLGTLRSLGAAPALLKLRHLRARQIF